MTNRHSVTHLACRLSALLIPSRWTSRGAWYRAFDGSPYLPRTAAESPPEFGLLCAMRAACFRCLLSLFAPSIARRTRDDGRLMPPFCRNSGSSYLLPVFVKAGSYRPGAKHTAAAYKCDRPPRPVGQSLPQPFGQFDALLPREVPGGIVSISSTLASCQVDELIAERATFG